MMQDKMGADVPAPSATVATPVRRGWWGRVWRACLKWGLVCLCVLVLGLIYLAVVLMSKVGDLPSQQEQARFAAYNYFEGEEFVYTPLPAPQIEQRTNLAAPPVGGGRNVLWRYLTGQQNSPPTPMPVRKVLPNDYPVPAVPLRVTWLGHSSLILEVDGVRVLIDPVLHNAGPLSFICPRFAPSPLDLDSLPALDAVLISHNHYDHFEKETVIRLAEMGKHFIVPLGVGSILRGWGCPAAQVQELAWEESASVGNLQITLVRGKHYSSRLRYDRNKTLWGGFVLRGAKHSAYFSGDCGYDGSFKQIGQKYGPFDLTMIEMGASNLRWRDSHLSPEEAIQAHLDVRGRVMLPVHWGAYDLAMRPWNFFIEATYKEAITRGVQMITPVQGEPCVPDTAVTTPWWR